MERSVLGPLPTRVPPRAASEQVWCDTEGDIREVVPDLRLVFGQRGEV